MSCDDLETEKLLDFMVSNRTTKQLRRIVYDNIRDANGGQVACFVCGVHVEWRIATLEHVIPRDRGGTDEESNLSISHCKCNNLKANHIMEKK